MKKEISYKTIIIKIGTKVITYDNGLLNLDIMKQIAKQIVELKKKNIYIALISSGAMGAGKALIDINEKHTDVTKRQILAAIGQVELINTYNELFSEYGMKCAQILATKSDFRDRGHYLNMKNCFNAFNQYNVIPILNENDVVSVTELMFTDNDELAGLVASMLNADSLIIMTGVDGLFDRDPNDKNAKLIKKVDFTKSLDQYIAPTKSISGRGGMKTKCAIAKKLSSLGIKTYIVNGLKKNILIDLCNGKTIGTVFIPEKNKNVSSVKKWVANSQGHEKGIVYIDDGAKKALLSRKKAISLLPIGIEKIEGDFQRGDVVQIKDKYDNVIGLGMAEYSLEKAKNIIGLKDEKPLIHYDYLYIY